MKRKKVIRYLINYQHWRRGADIPQPDPTELGKALDAAIAILSKEASFKECLGIGILYGEIE